MTAGQIVSKAVKLMDEARWGVLPLIVFTGGEPLLQLDEALLRALRYALPGTKMAIETNGTVKPKPGVLKELSHVCVSPKTMDYEIVLRRGNELKVVWPAYNPSEYADLAMGFDHCFISPEAETSEVGKSLVVIDRQRGAAEYCLANPQWRLSLQQHKTLNLP